MAFRKCFEFKEVSLQYRSSGVATFGFSTDMPGGGMAQRKSATIPTSGGITLDKTLTIPLDGIMGTTYQPEIVPPNGVQFIPLSGVMYVRPIGVYLDGSLGEVWRPQPAALGV